ncbi:MAG: division/cell wall cluster transcriptional repressor MraZ [Lachnospiraceae bacterium]|nr:division/cell wall cluster transcriptional repressor MraZ [Candidatus Minthocola equi]
MFIGEYNHTIDAKGRLIIPAKFRDQLGKEFVVTGGLDGCLYIFTKEEWTTFEEKLHALPISNPNARKFSRFFLSNADTCEVDKQGRALIKSELRLLAGLNTEVVLAGVGGRIEIWDKAKWNEAASYDDMEEIASNMEQLGI